MIPMTFNFNNGYNDDDALRMAIAQSIEEEIVPPDQRIHLQPNNEHFFEQNMVNPVSERATRLIEMCKRNQEKITKLLSLNVNSPANSSHNSPKTIRIKKEEQFSSSQEIRREQDEAYLALLRSVEEDQNEVSHNSSNILEDDDESDQQTSNPNEDQNQIEENQDVNITNQAQNQANESENESPEPEDGIIIAIIFPDRSRLSRKFLPTSSAISVYKWCHIQPQLSSIGISDFEIVFPTGEILDSAQTLENQHVLTKSLFNIRLK